MRLSKARVCGYRSVIDSDYFDVENGKTILVGPNEAGKTAILQALYKLNPPEGTELFNPLRDYPRAKYDEDIEKGGIDPAKFTVVEGHFTLDDSDKASLPEAYHDITYVRGRYLDNKTWHRIDGGPEKLLYSALDKDLQKISLHFQATCTVQGKSENIVSTIQAELDKIIGGLKKTDYISFEKATALQEWLKKNLPYLEDENTTENKRYDKLSELLELPGVRSTVLMYCEKSLPVFILFSNYFRIKPVLHLRKLAERIDNKTLDDDQYDYGNICLLKFLGFTAKDLADAGDVSKFDLARPGQYDKFKEQLDTRDYKLNAATIRLTDATREVWNPTHDGRDANKLRIKADGQYLKVVVEDELGVEVELDQRSEGFQWMVSFYVVFFAEASHRE